MSCREDALVLSDARPDQWKCEVEEKYVLTKRKAHEQVKKMEQEYEESSSKRNKWYVCCSCKFCLILILFAYYISNLNNLYLFCFYTFCAKYHGEMMVYL